MYPSFAGRIPPTPKCKESPVRTVILVDDIDPERTKNVETITFSIRGKDYEVDLSSKSQRELDEALAPFLAVARRVPRAAAQPKARKRQRIRQDSDAAEIRAWAIAHGHALGERGRIPASIRLEYLNSLAR